MAPGMLSSHEDEQPPFPYFALDLIIDDEGRCLGLIALGLEDGSLHRFRASKTIKFRECLHRI
jgi:succinate dehydrogenase/fumarate reductase flavoprotein subunit